MALYGYARVSSSDQDFAVHEQAMRAADCDVVRTELQTLLDRSFICSYCEPKSASNASMAGFKREPLHLCNVRPELFAENFSKQPQAA